MGVTPGGHAWGLWGLNIHGIHMGVAHWGGRAGTWGGTWGRTWGSCMGADLGGCTWRLPWGDMGLRNVVALAQRGHTGVGVAQRITHGCADGEASAAASMTLAMLPG